MMKQIPEGVADVPFINLPCRDFLPIRITSRTKNHLYLETNPFSAMIWRFIVNLVA